MAVAVLPKLCGLTKINAARDAAAESLLNYKLTTAPLVVFSGLKKNL